MGVGERIYDTEPNSLIQNKIIATHDLQNRTEQSNKIQISVNNLISCVICNIHHKELIYYIMSVIMLK